MKGEILKIVCRCLLRNYRLESLHFEGLDFGLRETGRRLFCGPMGVMGLSRATNCHHRAMKADFGMNSLWPFSPSRSCWRERAMPGASAGALVTSATPDAASPASDTEESCLSLRPWMVRPGLNEAGTPGSVPPTR